MVRAMLDGRKTQTRRPIKYISDLGNPEYWCPKIEDNAHFMGDYRKYCPYGAIGDRLWVRETWADIRTFGFDDMNVCYAADTIPGSEGDEIRIRYGVKWKPSIHMPRWASRITLEITNIWVERLLHIREDNAKSEGVSPVFEDGPDSQLSYRQAFFNIWRDIYEDRYPLNTNPWVWVVTFKVDEE